MQLRFLNARSARYLSRAIFFATVLLLPLGAARAADEGTAEALPHQLGHSLRQLVAWHRAQPGNLSAPERRTRLAKELPARVSRVQTNADATRAVVDVTLDGSVPLSAVRESLTNLGAEVFAEYDAHRAGSTLSARLPLDQAEAAARTPGVYSLSLAHRAWRRVGLTTSQGAKVLKTNRVNKQLHFDGTGITVGVLSDSFDARQVVVDGKPEGYVYTTSAADDAMDDDLPGFGNPLGHTEPVHVITEALPGDDYQLNEGRAMLQIVHDLAPGAGLAFQRAGETAVELAANITKLRTQTTAPCDVIVDDFGFPDEPFFSDGPAALAARDASSNLLVAGKPVVYVSSAGNEGDVAYNADFEAVSDADARSSQGTGNLKLDKVPRYLTAGGFHNFNPKAGKVTLAQKVELHGAAEASFQWDDPFIPGKITADYNLLVFDAQGNYLPDLSGTDDNVALGKPLEIVDLPLGEGNESITYQFAITRRMAATIPGMAHHLCYVLQGGAPTVKFLGYNHATTHGHNAGPGVIGVAAYAYDQLGEPEPFSSLGPVTIYFDSLGNRLATPEVRQQPSVAAVDGVNTSFFPPGPLKNDDGTPNTDTDGDGFPNFFGTSAAAPHVAAVAALLLQAGGGPGSLTPAQVLEFLKTTARPHDLDPNFVSATLLPTDGSTITLSATGDETNAAAGDKNGFHLAFDGAADRFLSKVVIDLGSTGLKFDPSADLGFAFTTGTKVGLKPTDVTGVLDAANTTLTLSFVPGAFTAGRSLNFGVDRDLSTTSTDGNSADLLTGAIVKVRTKGETGGPGKAQGTLASQMGTGYSPAAGYGLVDAQAAVNALLANPPPTTASLTSGNLLLASSDNRVFEAKPDGTLVRAFTVPNPAGDGTPNPGVPMEAVADGNGNIAVLNGGTPAHLITINPVTGVSTSLTAPNWSLTPPPNSFFGLPGDMVSFGRYIFASYIQSDPHNPLGLGLRFDLANGTVQAFGTPSATAYKSYGSLAIGPDGLLYALVAQRGYPANPVDVYDPNTLALVRTISIQVGEAASLIPVADKFSIGPDGAFYMLFIGVMPSVYKFSSDGHKLASFNPPNDPKYPYQSFSIRTNAQGTVVVGSWKPVLTDPLFQTVTQFNIFGTTYYYSPPMVTAIFIP